MLDDLKYIHSRDSGDALGIAAKQWQQLLYDFEFKWEPPKTIYEVIIAGMGGSGLAAKAYKRLTTIEVPIDIIQDYDLPDRADTNTLLICSSYSGNTEETLSVFKQAFDEYRILRPMVVVICSGGELLKLAKKHKVPYILLPQGLQPRYTFGYQYRALVELFENTPLIDWGLKELEFTSKALQNVHKPFLPDIKTINNQAKQIALDIVGKAPIIYAASEMLAAAYKWKISINENAKNIAWYNEFPEFNHNEFLGWSSHPIDKPYAPIFLQSSFDNPRITKRFDLTKKLLSGKMPNPIVVQAKGDSQLEQFFYLTILGDFVSLYLALLNNVDPTPVKLIEKLKKELA